MVIASEADLVQSGHNRVATFSAASLAVLRAFES